MPRVSSRRLIKPAGLVLLVVGALLPMRSDLGRVYQALVGSAHHLVQPVVAVGARPFAALTAALRDDPHDPRHFRDLSQANRRIETQRSTILQLWRENEQLRRENAALQEIRRQLGRERYVFRPARVMARSTDPATRTITLNRGAAAGVAEGAAVVSGPHLVGLVVDAGRVTCDVQLITAPGTQFQAVIAPEVWTLQTIPEQRLRQPARFKRTESGRFVAVVHEDMLVSVGDVAHLSDPTPTWPDSAQGRIVGQVVEVAPVHEPPLRKRVVLEPLDELFFRDEVTIILPRQP